MGNKKGTSEIYDVLFYFCMAGVLYVCDEVHTWHFDDKVGNDLHGISGNLEGEEQTTTSWIETEI